MDLGTTLIYKGVLRGNKRKSGIKSILANPNFTELQDGMVIDMRTGHIWMLR
jgi:hypothetical protein